MNTLEQKAMTPQTTRRSLKIRFFEKVNDGEIRFDFARFQQWTFGQMIVLLLIFSPLIARQVQPHFVAGAGVLPKMAAVVAPWLLLLGWTAVFYVVAAFFEWIFHRYLFHIVPNFMARKHTLHHYMHPVKNYQTHEDEQTESAHFPVHALVAFLAVFSLATWPLQHRLPHQPILLAVNIAVCLAYYRYELTHAQKHYSIDWQLGKLNDPRSGRGYEDRFVLHFIHHDKTQYNMAVFAEDIMSLPDRLLGTYLPGHLLRDAQGQIIVGEEEGIPYFTILLPDQLPKPIWPARILDRLSLHWQALFFRLFPTKRREYHF